MLYNVKVEVLFYMLNKFKWKIKIIILFCFLKYNLLKNRQLRTYIFFLKSNDVVWR